MDDEAVVRIGLKSMINWQNQGFELIGEESDGKKALDVIKLKEPDIVITDIKMPVMDGIELIKQIKKDYKDIKVIVLSSYNDFYLVKEAMRLGAHDYILKLEMEAYTLLGVLKKLREQAEKQSHIKTKRETEKRQIRKNMSVMRRNFLRDILNNLYVNEQEIIDAIEFLQINLNNDFVNCLIIKIGELHRFEEVTDEELHILNYSIINIIEEIINDSFDGYCFEGKTGEFCVFLSNKNKKSEKIINRDLIDVSERIIDMLKLYLNIRAVIGIGEGGAGIQGLQLAYTRAIEAIKFRFFEGYSRYILWNQIRDIEFTDKDYSVLQYKDRIFNALSLLDKKEITDIFSLIVEDLSILLLSRKNLCKVTLELFYIISEYFDPYQINMVEVLNTSYRSYEQLMYMYNYTEVKEWIIDVKENILQYITNQQEIDYNRIIARAKKYISENYNQDISLKEVADEVNLSPSYFSTVFKSFCGSSYSQYITNIRVDNAKVLLTNTNLKVYEIAEQVGYHNAYYFNRIFKKVTGLSPGEYKNDIKIQ